MQWLAVARLPSLAGRRARVRRAPRPGARGALFVVVALVDAATRLLRRCLSREPSEYDNEQDDERRAWLVRRVSRDDRS